MTITRGSVGWAVAVFLLLIDALERLADSDELRALNFILLAAAAATQLWQCSRLRTGGKK